MMKWIFMAVRGGLVMSGLLLGGLLVSGCITTSKPAKPGSAQAHQPVPPSGEMLFQRHCTSCHGKDASGNGPIAQLLKSPPPDLTTFSRRRNGQFSYVELARFIDGRQDVAAHGSRMMPVWGKQFARAEEDPSERESVVSGNLLELVLYIEAIQKK